MYYIPDLTLFQTNAENIPGYNAKYLKSKKI